MSEPKILEFLENCGIFISQSTISRILTNDETGFNKEKEDIFLAALGSTPYHQIDDTTVRVNGKNQYSLLAVAQKCMLSGDLKVHVRKRGY